MSLTDKIEERLYNTKRFFHLEDPGGLEWELFVFGRVAIPGFLIVPPLVILGVLSLIAGLPAGIILEIVWLTVLSSVVIGGWVLFILTVLIVFLSEVIEVRGPKS